MLANAFLLMRIGAFAAFVPLLSRLPIRRLQALVEPNCAHPEIESTEDATEHAAKVERIIRYTNLVCRIARPLIARRCMTRGLTLYFFLRRTGVDASLVFGVGNIRDNFEGHCWLVRDGEPYLETTDPRSAFTPVYAFNDPRCRHYAGNRIGEVRG